jgi:hypothetical protein
MTEVKAAEYRREQIGGDGGAGADTEKAPLEAAQFAEFALGDALNAEQLAGTDVESPTGVGEPDRSPGAVDEREIEFRLQLLEGLGDGWLAEVERGRSLGEAVVVYDRGEEAEVVEIHAYYK